MAHNDLIRKALSCEEISYCLKNRLIINIVSSLVDDEWDYAQTLSVNKNSKNSIQIDS